MSATAAVSEHDLRAMLAHRSGLEPDALWAPVYDVPRAFGLSWPLTRDQSEQVLTDLLDTLRRVLPAPWPDQDEELGQRYRYLAEITDRYERYDTRRILERIQHAGITPASAAFGGDDYDPSLATEGETASWARAVRAAGPRPCYRMPDPYVGEGEPPVDRALGLRESTADPAAYHTALRAAVREDPRQIDCWAHLGIEAFERAGTDADALAEALGYYQTGVAVAELSLPPAFTGVLTWGELDNRPFHRALHGLGLTWWRLGENAKAAAVFGNSLWINPDDNQGIRTLIGQVLADAPWRGEP
ncbi:hypothetical protein [Streptomyces justiciae]|uniref:hypothetical protein n=1 Tax=Streptomyces justiciae TaxID=2780140 RepID=UPI001881C65A|nr:hypothetical protein [Streptomyces justiciae]MBE8477485.1 hypothetical protein [Streptomyces justiciae]